MLCQLFEMPFELDVYGLRSLCQQLFLELGCLRVQAWPDAEEWLPEQLDDLPALGSSPAMESFRLTEKELKTTLMPELSTIYSINDSLTFAKFFIVAMRHIEFPPIFTPSDVTRSELMSLIRLGDSFSYPQVKKTLISGRWFLGIGVYSVCEEADSVLFVCDSQARGERVKQILEGYSIRIHTFTVLDDSSSNSAAGSAPE